MLVKQIGKLLCLVVICVAFVLSFRSYAPFLSPHLNSDHAIHILMAYDLKLPDDLYYWGQSRLGSIVPIWGHVLLKIFPISPAEAVSYVQYFFLLVGYGCFASFLKHPISRAILAIAWFLPLQYLTGFLRIGQPYAGQFAFTGIAIVLLNQLIQHPDKFLGRKRQLVISLCTLNFFIAFWISDFTIIIMLIIAGIALRKIYFRDIYQSTESRFISKETAKKYFSNPEVVNVLTISSICFLLIRYAKSTSLKMDNQFGFSNLFEFAETASKLFISFFRTLTFQSPSIFQTIFAIIATSVILYLTYLALKKGGLKSISKSRWFNVFLASAILGFILLIWSEWVYRNNVNLRYFVPVYLYGWMSVLLLVESLQKRTARVLGAILLCAAISSSLSLPNYVYSFKMPISKIQRLKPIEALGSIGIIGDYWSSYILCGVNPAQLSCTPYDARKGQFSCPPDSLSEDLQRVRKVRCPRCVRRVFEAKIIYLVKERWLDSLRKPLDFPDKTEQFGQCLVKIGSPIKVSGYTLAPYKRMMLK